MSECDSFGEALERRLSGALPEAEAGPLEAHLAACDACRDYLATCQRVEQALLARAEAPPASELVRTRVERHVTGRRTALRGLGLILGVTLAAPLVDLALSHLLWGGANDDAWAALGVLPVPLVGALFLWRELRRAEADVARGELLTLARRDADHEIRGLLALRWGLPALALFFIGAAIVEPPPGWMLVMLAGEVLMMLGAGLYAHWKLPRVRREREALQ